MENANNLLFRASSMSDIMSGTGKGWAVKDSKTCKQKLVQMYREDVWKRRNPLKNKYVEKGLAVEQDSITLYCRVKKEVFKKNDIRLNNDYFTGELDLFSGTEIKKARKVIDIKSSWSWATFPSIVDCDIKDYKEQGQVYMDLSGAEECVIAYCLVNTPGDLIVDEKKRLGWKMGIIDIETPEYIEGCKEIEKNCIYEIDLFLRDNPGFEFHNTNWDFDIPAEQRVTEMYFKKDLPYIYKMKQRVIESREWLNINFYNLNKK